MLRLWSAVAAGLFVLVLSPSLALAEEGGILDPRFDLGIWTIVVFVLLFIVLRLTAWKPMLEGLQKREDTIRGSLEEAKRSRDEMEKMKLQFKAEMDTAYAEIPKLMEQARRDAQQIAEEIRAKANADVAAERQRLRREMDTARDQALQELWTQAAQLATLISAKAIGRSLSEDDHRRLMQESLDEMQQVRRG